MNLKIKDFNLTQTLECGQCFRWNKTDETYVGVAKNTVLRIRQKGDILDLDCDEKEFNFFWKDYFDLSRDYKKIKEILSNDETMKNAIEYCDGIRLLKQDPTESIISFIISANNNIPRIKKIIQSLCENFGEKILKNGAEYYGFPTAEALAQLTLEDIDIIKSGFRGKYILDAAKKISNFEVDINKIYTIGAEEGREELKKIKGVGDKVADCVLLFAYQKYGVFPKDVWIKKVLTTFYAIDDSEFKDFPQKKFGDLAGFAQQYLFYYARDNKL